MRTWDDDAGLFALIKEELNSAVLGDVLDAAGHLHRFLPQAIRPLRDDLLVVGRAMPVLGVDDSGGEDPGRRSPVLGRPFGLMLEALDDLRPGEVYLCTGPSPRFALWGELMSTCARNRGAAGAVVDGYCRDTRGILALGFPTFSRGPYARDQRPRGKVVDFRCAVEVEGVRVRPGDLVFGDPEGTLVIPREIEADIVRLAWEKAHGERRVARAIREGMGAREAWDTYGIL